MFTIENKHLQVVLAAKGAELQSIYHKGHDLEYMWKADPAFWGKHSPILFPIVGTLKADQYFYNGKPYSLSRHGFARDMPFDVGSQKEDSIEFILKSIEKTISVYPFQFTLSVFYSLNENKLITTYTVANSGSIDLYFSIGGHPAFSVPLVGETNYDDYYLEFNKSETLGRWPISKDGLIEKEPIPLLNHENRLQLSKKLFYQDAIVLKRPASNVVSLKSLKTPHGFDFSFDGFPYLGIWAARDADFVCVEPWCGIADKVDSDQDFLKKEGIKKLTSRDKFVRSWSVSVF
ncbi:MAG TPA: aldose 1-epimerase family protein [Puia sp.]|nr:aldose 1-epimerase family protein [Puia sp.]